MDKNGQMRLSWYSLLGILLILGIYFRAIDLDREVYWHDEVYTSIRSTGYTGEEVAANLFIGEPLSAQTLLQYQQLTPDKGWPDTWRALARHPEHPPLYYLMSRQWQVWFGSSIAAVRSLSVLFGLLVFPCLYGLCRVLFPGVIAAEVAVAMMAVSPFFVLYAREARQYSLWTVLILLTHLTLGRSLERKTLVSWSFYALTSCLGFYTMLLHPAVTFAQGLYVVSQERLKFTRTIASYLLAVGGAAIAYLPWLIVVFANRDLLQQKTAWTTQTKPLSILAIFWGLHVSDLFIDWGWSSTNTWIYLVFAIVLIVVGTAIAYLIARQEPHRWLLISTLVIPALILILPDLLFGGQRSINTRYFVPSLISIQLACIYLFAQKIPLSRVWRSAFALLLTCGLISCIAISRADAWWTKAMSIENPRAAEVINASSQPLIISDPHNDNQGNLISLAHSLESNVQLLLVVPPDIPPIAYSNYSDIFLYRPSPELRQQLRQRDRACIEPIPQAAIILSSLQPQCGTKSSRQGLK